MHYTASRSRSTVSVSVPQKTGLEQRKSSSGIESAPMLFPIAEEGVWLEEMRQGLDATKLSESLGMC